MFGLNLFLKRKMAVNVCMCMFVYVGAHCHRVGGLILSLLVCETTEAKEMAGSVGVSGTEM